MLHVFSSRCNIIKNNFWRCYIIVNYTTEGVLSKLNITKGKLDKLVNHGYIDTYKESHKSGSYSYEIKYYNKEQVDALSSKKIEEALKKIKLQESRNLEDKYINKCYRNNSKMVKSCRFDCEVQNMKLLSEEINKKIDSTDYPRDIKFYGRRKKLDENTWYKVYSVGTYTFDFYKDSLCNDRYPTDKPSGSGGILDYNEIYSICIDYEDYYSFWGRNYNNKDAWYSYILADVEVEVVDIHCKYSKRVTRIGFIKDFKPIRRASIKCDMCEKTVVYEDAISNHDGKNICSVCKDRIIRKRQAIKERKEIFEDILSNKDEQFLIIDMETSAGSSYQDIISLSIINPCGETLIDTLLEPKTKVSDEVCNALGVSVDSLKDYPSVEDIKDKLVEIISGKTLIFYSFYHWCMFGCILINYKIDVDRKKILLESVLYMDEDVEFIKDPLGLKSITGNTLKDCHTMLNLIRGCEELDLFND